MRDIYNKNSCSVGFSILEVVIAFAVVMVAVTGALSSQFMADYWTLSTQLSREALSIIAEHEGIMREQAEKDFVMVSSTAGWVINQFDTPMNDSCTHGGVCYAAVTEVLDISSCAKNSTTQVSWSGGGRYATGSVSSLLSLFNYHEIISRGGDCPLQTLENDRSPSSLSRHSTATETPHFVTGMDVLQDRIYVTASSVPMFQIFERPAVAATTPRVLRSSTVLGNRLNAVDVIRDMASGRVYAYVVQHTRTEQLVVIDVTDDVMQVVATRSLAGTDANGSFPQGWRVVVYGARLYVTTRETAGAELHIFALTNPTNPVEIGAINVARTINDMAVTERFIDGMSHRYVLLAASAALKEFSIYDVTNDIPVERLALDIPGTENMLSIFQNGDTVYLGRAQTATGPELYQYHMSSLLSGSTTPLAVGEVGADVHTIRGVGSVLLLGTSKSTAELQLWRTAPASWNGQTGRIGSSAAARVVPLGIDVGQMLFYTVTQSVSQPEQLTVWSVL